MAGIAVVGASGALDPFPLERFIDEPVFELLVGEPGTYVVFARVVIQNSDGAHQNATVRLAHGFAGPDLLDWVDIRIPNDASYAVSLEGTLIVPDGGVSVIELRCSTLNGFARRPWVIAVQVDALKFN